VEVNGKTIASRTVSKTGQMLIPVSKGESHVEVSFTRTWDRALGILISLIAAACAACIGVWQRRARGEQTA
jgi:hypothetical protein